MSRRGESIQVADVTRPGRRAVLRALAASPLLLIPMPSVAAASTSRPSAPSIGSSDVLAGSLGWSDLDTTFAPDWMAALPDTSNPTTLSLPGTHDTMAFSASFIGATQDFDLATQLRAGIRVLDIRTRHIRDAFTIHHGLEYLHANFTGVVRTVADFLRENPSETVFMRMASEYRETENTRSYEDTLDWYIHENPDTRDLLAEYLWTPPAGYDGRIPDLGATRGMVVILQSFTATGVYGPRWGGSDMDIQDDYTIPSLAAIETKWSKVRTQFERAAQGPAETMFVNGLNATSGEDLIAVARGVWPISIAKGAPGFTGIVPRTEDYLRENGTGRTGVVMMDFPSAAVVEAIIARNFS
ncbi:phosphatidylinositol-specific phospholipase C domain-containing protein [Rhodococcus spongiicola]|uniref:1-phosphatidylinositol phosphodiesterase n=1 Tax=Rhodococcus spongiicola TaxID=2487352 RepID=A0A3S3DWT0_9NOCA|nr:phosphatidylinositol-specific phospholipase C domain-containing protein [Rhodococcus spongiicola]